jgi:signal transduction histidine kinase
MIALLAAGLAVLGLLSVFAIELSDTQAKSKRDVEARVHERGVLAAALIDSLFGSVAQQIPQDARNYGGPMVSQKALDHQAAQGQNTYLAVLDGSGRVLAYTAGFNFEARQDLAKSASLALVRAGYPYATGDILPYGLTGVINLAVAFPTRFGPRILLTGFRPKALGTFIDGELAKIPGVPGAYTYLVDGNNAVLGSTNPTIRIGSVLDSLQQAPLRQPSADVGGHYYDQVPLTDSTWRLVLAAPDGPLFSSVSGLRKWIPWVIFVAFAMVAGLALTLGVRVARSSSKLRSTNARLAQANQELEASNQQLDVRARELARSNQELEQFASIASHDLKEPLRKVRTFTQQLSVTDSERLSDRGRDYIDRANSAAERMQQLIDDLLKYSRVATHGRPFAPVVLGQVAQDVLRDLELSIARSGASVRVGELPTINADALQMRQLLQNLISNALKFRRDGVAPEVTVDGAAVGGVARIVVRDNGIGFEPRYNERIFRVFERLHGRGQYPGTGIGLALCRKIAERHGGSVVADGVPGVGSSFTVTLPVDLECEVLVADGNGQPAQEVTHVGA